MVAGRRRPGTARAGSTRSPSTPTKARRCCSHRVRRGPTSCPSTGRCPPTSRETGYASRARPDRRRARESARAQSARDERDLLRRHAQPVQRVAGHLDRELLLAEYDLVRAGFPQVVGGFPAMRPRNHADALVGAPRHLDHPARGLRIGKRDHEQDRAIEVSALEYQLVPRIAIEANRSLAPATPDDPSILFDDEALHVAALERPRDQRPDLSVPADHGMMPQRVLNLALDARERAGAPFVVAAGERKPTRALGTRIHRAEEKRGPRGAGQRR